VQLLLDLEQVLEERERGFYPYESFEEMDKLGNLGDAIGSEVVYL
jgi:hypothetical protein